MTDTPEGHIVASHQKPLSWLKPRLPVQETTSSAVVATIERPDITRFIEIAGVRMEAVNLGAPTQEEIDKFHMVELRDGDGADGTVPQYGYHTINDYEVFKQAFPYYASLTEEQATEQHLFPHTYCAYNKLARNAVLTNRNKREWNDTEWAKLTEYATGNGNNEIITAMKAWFVGYRNAGNREFHYVGDWASFGVSDDASGDDIPYVWFGYGSAGVSRSSTYPGHLMVVRAFSDTE